tara:strand:+ start:11267 stop:11776 length:510 start_codon:yes stop_codon:yes gene_type:complete
MLSKEKIERYIDKWKETKKVRMYAPLRYFTGLKRMKDVFARLDTMKRRIEQAKNGVSVKKLLRKFQTDTKVKTKPSTWTQKFHKAYPGVGGKKTNISKATGISVKILNDVYKRGEKAYLTGHRPGATPQQWGYGRMYSFIMRYNKSSLTHDKDLAKQVIASKDTQPQKE